MTGTTEKSLAEITASLPDECHLRVWPSRGEVGWEVIRQGAIVAGERELDSVVAYGADEKSLREWAES